MNNTDLTIDGDLNQIAVQSRFLRSYGLVLKRSDVYSIVKAESVESALSLLWSHSIPGWWHYEDRYIELGICNKEEFHIKLCGI